MAQRDSLTRRGIWLTVEGAQLLEPHLGPIGAGTRVRFTGVPSLIEHEDRGDAVPRALWRGSATLVDPYGQMRALDRGVLSTWSTGARGSTLEAAGISGAGRADIGITTDGANHPDSWWHYIKHTQDEGPSKIVPVSEWEQLIEQAGHLLAMNRNGIAHLRNHTYMDQDGTALYLGATVPVERTIVRDHVRGPVTWSKGPGRQSRVRASVTLTDGSLGYFTVYSQWGAPLSPHAEDLTAMVGAQLPGIGPAGPYHAVAARVERAAPVVWTPDTVTIDLARLITHPDPGYRAVARTLLNLEHGDAIALGNDWDTQPGPTKAGVYYATRIEETITAHHWLISLELMPFQLMTGHPRPNPLPPGGTWDTRFPAPTTWDDVPVGVTWDTPA